MRVGEEEANEGKRGKVGRGEKPKQGTQAWQKGYGQRKDNGDVEGRGTRGMRDKKDLEIRERWDLRRSSIMPMRKGAAAAAEDMSRKQCDNVAPTRGQAMT